MDIMKLAEHRTQLFEVIDTKMGNMYHTTRSRKNTEEIREYVLVLLFLCREYLEKHKNHLLLQRYYTRNGFLNPMPSFLGTMDMQNLLPERTWEQGIIMKDIHAIRGYFAWIFKKILEIHSVLEKMDYDAEERKRYIWIQGNKYLKPRRGGGKGRSLGNSSLGTKLETWSGIFRARHSYDCDRCPFHIEQGELYEKEVIRLGEGVEILRYHINCPDLPDDPEKYREDEVSEDLSFQQAA